MSLTESVRYIIDADDRASAKVRKHNSLLKAMETASSKRESKAISAGEAIIKSSKSELDKIREKIDAVRAYGRTSGKAFLEAKDSLRKLIKEHKAVTKAIEEQSLADARSARKKKIAAAEEIASLKKIAKEKADSVRNRSGQSAAGAIGQVGGAAGEAASNVSFLISEFEALGDVGGKAGAVMKAGLVGVAVVVGLKVGKALGDVIFQTQLWNRELVKNTEELGDLGRQASQTLSRLGNRQFRQIELIRDPARQEQELKTLAKTLQKEISGITKQIESEQAKLSSSDFEGYLWDASDEAKENQRQVIENAKQVRDLRREQLQRAQDETSEYKKHFDLVEKRQALADRGRDFTSGLEDEVLRLKIGNEKYEERKSILDAIAVTSNNLTRGDVKRIKETIAAGKELSDSQIFLLENETDLRFKKIRALQQEKSALKAIAEQEIKAEEARRKRADEAKRAADEAKRAADQRLQQEKRIAETQSKALQNIKLQLIESTKGKAAAEAFRLRQIGFSKDEAQGLARLKDQIGKLKESAGKSTVNVGNNTATDDRLGNGRAESTFQKTAEAIESERQTKIQEKMKTYLEQLVQFERSRKDQPLVVVGK